MADDRDSILDTVRIRFDRALRSDYRALEDLVMWAPSLLPTVNFGRAMDLIAEAHATRGPVANNVVQLAAVRAVQQQRPANALWIPIDSYPTSLRTGAFSLFVLFVDHVRQRVHALEDRTRLTQFTNYLQSFAERNDICYAGSIEAVQNPAASQPQSLGPPGTRATADLGFSQLGGASWSFSRTQIRLTISLENGQILGDYQTFL